MIRLNIIQKNFKNKKIFEKTEIKIEEGSFICIKGESGIGKTTLLSMIGLLQEFDGEYYVDDKIVLKKEKEKFRVELFSYLFQKAYLLPYLNIKENLLFGANNLKLEIDDAFFDEIIDTIGIKDLLDKNVKTLSGGEAQRVALGRAIFSKRKYLLCDEPTGNLDTKNAKRVMELLKFLNTNYKTTVIIVTHSDNFDFLFDKIYVIEDLQVKGQ